MSGRVGGTTFAAVLMWSLLVSAVVAVGVAPLCGCAEGDPAANAQEEGGARADSGLRGRTIFHVAGGAEGARGSTHPASIEFAVVPIEGGTPRFSAAHYVRSDRDGTFEVRLPPGEYRIVSKERAQDPDGFQRKRGRLSFWIVEQTVRVESGAFTEVDVVQESAAP